MFCLTREVRIGVNPGDDAPTAPVTNGYAGWPSLRGVGHFFALRATVCGDDLASGYLVDIKRIDAAVREHAVPILSRAAAAGANAPAAPVLVATLFQRLSDAWEPGLVLRGVRLMLSPYLAVECRRQEFPAMTRLSQKFEFAASHRLHAPALSDDENRRIFGKCNNPHGHGHNYELEVTVAGTPDPQTGLLIDVPHFERIVNQTVIDRFDHKNLNAEVPEFQDLIPSVENIARVIHRLLKPKLQTPTTRLAGVTVWETPKTWCEYAE